MEGRRQISEWPNHIASSVLECHFNHHCNQDFVFNDHDAATSEAIPGHVGAAGVPAALSGVTGATGKVSDTIRPSIS